MERRNVPVLDVLWAGDPDFTCFSLKKNGGDIKWLNAHMHSYTHKINLETLEVSLCYTSIAIHTGTGYSENESILVHAQLVVI